MIDEFNYIGDILTLEALAKTVAFYPEYSRLHVVVSSSEGFIMDYMALGRLSGYRTRIVFVDEMSGESFTELYREYCSSNPCKVGLEEYLELVGGLPGYLREVAELGGDELKGWVEQHKAMLREAINLTAYNLGVNASTVLNVLRQLLCNEEKPGDPLSYRVAQELVKANILYPVGFTGRYKPQIKLYAKLVCKSQL